MLGSCQWSYYATGLSYMPKFCLFLFLLSSVVCAQELSPLQIVDKAIAEAGGETWARPQTLQLSGHATFYDQGKADKVTHIPIYKMWRVFPAENDAAHKANGKVRFDAFIGDKLYFQISFDGQQSYSNYSPEFSANKEAAQWENAFGFSILRFARNPGFVLSRNADDQIEGHPCYFIRVVDPKQNITDFGIDKKDFSIRSVSFRTPLGFHHRIYSEFQWHINPRFRQPGRMRVYYDGAKWTEVVWEKYTVNQPIADEIFTEVGKKAAAAQ
jgi:hypothetical protein